MRRPATHRRTGSAYLLVLGVAMLVTIIGLSSLLVGRLRLRVAALNNSAIQADCAATSVIELALLRITNDPSWRTTYTHDTWTADETIGDITFSFKLVDEWDGDLATGMADPARLLGKATVGDVVRIYSVLLSTNSDTVLDRRVATVDDDAEERLSNGAMSRRSWDLDIAVGSTGGATDIVGMRFPNITAPDNATIQNAYVQFKADETDSGAIALTITGEDVDDAAQFTDSDYDITSRSTTGASVAWSPPAWNTVGEVGADQQTPDISSIIQEILDRPGWTGGNALVIIITGTGTRTAEAYDGDPSGAPLLHVEWTGSSTTDIVPSTFQREITP